MFGELVLIFLGTFAVGESEISEKNTPHEVRQTLPVWYQRE